MQPPPRIPAGSANEMRFARWVTDCIVAIQRGNVPGYLTLLRNHPRRPIGTGYEAQLAQYFYDSIISYQPNDARHVRVTKTTRGIIHSAIPQSRISPNLPTFPSFTFTAISRVYWAGGAYSEAINAAIAAVANCTVNGLSPAGNINYSTREEAIAALIQLPATCRIESPYDRETVWIHENFGPPDHVPATITIPALGFYEFTIPDTIGGSSANAPLKVYGWALQP